MDPTYTIIIPTSVDFGTLVKTDAANWVTEDFDVAAQGVVIESGASIDVDVTGPFVMNDDDGVQGSVELPYILSNEAGAITITLADPSAPFATFPSAATADGKEDGSVVCQYGRYHRRGQLQWHDGIHHHLCRRSIEVDEFGGTARLPRRATVACRMENDIAFVNS